MPKTVIVTGASKGIGGVTAIAFGKAGYDVAISFKTDAEAADRVVKAIEGFGQKALAVQADTFSEAGIKRLFSAAKDEFGEVDVLVNNAGDASEVGFGKYNYDYLHQSLDANFMSAVLCTQAVMPLMPQGCVLFTSSIYGLQFGGNPTLPLYSASKAAMINYAQTMAEALAPNIRCNVVAPGTTKTPAWEGASDGYVQRSLDMTLQKEWVDAEEIAGAFVFLAETPHITGQTIVIDAGWQKKIRGQTVSKH